MELAEGMTEIFKNVDCAHLFKLLNSITATRMLMRMMGAHLPISKASPHSCHGVD